MTFLKEEFYFHTSMSGRTGEIPLEAITSVRMNSASLIVGTTMGFESGIKTNDFAAKFQEIKDVLAAAKITVFDINKLDGSPKQLLVLAHVRALIATYKDSAFDLICLPKASSSVVATEVERNEANETGLNDLFGIFETSEKPDNLTWDYQLKTSDGTSASRLMVRPLDINGIVTKPGGFALQCAEGISPFILCPDTERLRVIASMHAANPRLTVTAQTLPAINLNPTAP